MEQTKCLFVGRLYLATAGLVLILAIAAACICVSHATKPVVECHYVGTMRRVLYVGDGPAADCTRVVSEPCGPQWVGCTTIDGCAAIVSDPTFNETCSVLDRSTSLVVAEVREHLDTILMSLAVMFAVIAIAMVLVIVRSWLAYCKTTSLLLQNNQAATEK